MTERTRFIAWITKYALTEGIYSVDVEDCFNISEKMVTGLNRRDGCYHKPHWHRTRKEAVVQAEKMRAAKIRSLRKSIAKMERLDFS
jgi:hypothetical protein